MKTEKGMGLIKLIICVIIIIAIVLGITYFTKEKAVEEEIELYKTNMLIIQGKIKVIALTSNIKKDESLLIGRKIEEALEEEDIKQLLEKAIISQEDEKFSKYYIIEKQTLEEMGLKSIELKEGYFIVNYDTEEIIYSRGININENTYFKLEELLNLENKEDNTNTLQEQNNEQQEETTSENTEE